MIVAPSILSANFNNLNEEIKSINIDKNVWVHCDVMDGHFVPNITFGACVLKNIKKDNDVFLDVHLMIDDPYKYAIDFSKAGADLITFHYEAVKEEDIIKVINHIKSLGCKAGISIKPKTNPNVLDKYLELLDLVLVMSVEPGFGGQKFMDNALDKISYLSKLKKENNYKYLIEVDGGINRDTAKQVASNGCEVAVAGSYIFNSTNREELIKELLLL